MAQMEFFDLSNRYASLNAYGRDRRHLALGGVSSEVRASLAELFFETARYNRNFEQGLRKAYDFYFMESCLKTYRAMILKYKYFFTITADRTGSTWLASFLDENLKMNSIYAPLGIDEFGVRMPDIKLMRVFNMGGNTSEVQDFYKRKLYCKMAFLFKFKVFFYAT